MCALFGFVDSRNSSLLRNMSASMLHRGPDSQNFWESKECSFGLNRLAILDLEGGLQPCVNLGIASVMNGEIYNFRELRRELELLGYKFNSDHSDAELIPAAYVEWGLDFVSKLQGMFAIAIWDFRLKKLILVRDRVGKKPCYYALKNDSVYFASEIKALVAAGFGSCVSKKALFGYLAKKSVPAPLSIYEDVYQLPPACIVVFEKGCPFQEINYWKPRFDGSDVSHSENDYIEIIGEELERAVKLRCDMDVEFGSFLSGGLDSSLVSVLTAANTSNRLKTFTLAYEDDIIGKNEDERFASLVADMIGADRYIYKLSKEEVWRSISAVLSCFDEPFCATISPYFLCSLVSKYVKVALCGDGADELFGSYLTHRISADMDFGVTPKMDNIEWRSKMLVFNNDELSCMFGERVDENFFARAGEHADTQLHQTLESEFCDQLPNQVLKYADRLSMAHGVEVRSPFLDVRLIETIGHMQSSLKIKDGEVKYILKKAALRFLPKELVFRPKEGFVLPIWRWMDESWRDGIILEIETSDMYRDFGINKAYVDTILRDWKSGMDKRPKIWSLFVLSIWNRERKNAVNRSF